MLVLLKPRGNFCDIHRQIGILKYSRSKRKFGNNQNSSSNGFCTTIILKISIIHLLSISNLMIWESSKLPISNKTVFKLSI